MEEKKVLAEIHLEMIDSGDGKTATASVRSVGALRYQLTLIARLIFDIEDSTGFKHSLQMEKISRVLDQLSKEEPNEN